MLKLEGISKIYKSGEADVVALNDVNISFRSNEFVSILGPSGCGKTTMLNIIGGLDRYSSGDLSIKGRSTKGYKSSDWDAYRNHSIGFIFQSYNLIPHQTVLQNVELALTISGVSSKKRKQMAIDALKEVGLEEHINKRPNQLSGGQMQRVAIARALINNPEIVLADEPTGALDSKSSIQIMDILKKIANDRLVIMVTHNPDLASEYSTRIVKLFDGKIVDDTNPFDGQKSSDSEESQKKKTKGASMSFFTAVALSLNNLFTKKTRTILTSFAGSIGIIGISLILSMQNGVEAYITRVEEDTLSSYPIVVEETNTDFSDTITTLMGEKEIKHSIDDKKVYSNDIISKMMTGALNGTKKNDLTAFKSYIEKNKNKIKGYTSDIKYSYKTVMNIYNTNGYKVNPNNLFDASPMGSGASQSNSIGSGSSNGMSNMAVWTELIDNKDLLEKQYEIYGKMPTNYDEIVLIVDKNNEISDYTLYTLGLKDIDDFRKIAEKAKSGEKLDDPKQTIYKYNDLIGMEFKLLLNSDMYVKNENGTYSDQSAYQPYINQKLDDAISLKIVGIFKPSKDNKTSRNFGKIGYTGALMKTLIEKNNASEIVKYQKENPEIDIFTGLKFKSITDYTVDDIIEYVRVNTPDKITDTMQYIAMQRQQGVPDQEIVKTLGSNIETSSYEDNLLKMGVSDLDMPSSISFYPKDFQSKDKINDFIETYNKSKAKDEKIEYTDYVGLLMSGVTTIINAISYILIAFVSVSLIVSSIMIGIITYISVLERTKEIGILRAMGASKRNISNVFNAETLIIGLVSGLMGIGITILLLIPINFVIKSLTSIGGLAVLPFGGAVALIVISVLLTVISGLIPSSIAAKKDPVIALRTE